jgi:hypothetical protein
LTYSVKVKVENGAVISAETVGSAPDGAYHIDGHEDGSGRSVSVSRYKLDGHTILANASSYNRHEQIHASAD